MVVLVALSLTGLLLVVGLGIDAGRLFDVRRSAQAAADAGAFAGAAVLYSAGTAAQALAAAEADAADNGFSDSATTTVSVSSPPASGEHVNDSRYVEVVIVVEVKTLLLPPQVTNVRARGVAGVAPIDLRYAIVALDDSATNGALKLGPQGSLTITGGGIMVNSSHSTAADNSGIVTIPSGEKTDVVGGVGPQASAWPNLRTGRPITQDPFYGFPMPSTSGTNYGNPVCCSLQPGIYTGDIDGNNNWVLAAGTYILKGAGIDLFGNSSITGTGVFIFITQSTYPASGGTCANPTVKVTGNGASSLTPPTSGVYDGMLIYQDPACAGSITLGGNGALTTTGTIYAPSATVGLNGNNAAISASQIVADRVDVQNADITLTYSAAATAIPRIPALAE